MPDFKERQIPFTDEQMEEIKEMGKSEGRAFKWQAAALIKEAIVARKKKRNA